MALLIFANSITLTPGTVTIHVSVLGKFTVHAIDGKSARSLPGVMEKKIENIFV
jgi:multicomponent Na+:H+ antiporter subunit E